MDVLTAKLERGEFMCKLDPKDLRESINCILEENKIKNKDYLNKNNAYYSDIYNDTQSFIISKLRSY